MTTEQDWTRLCPCGRPLHYRDSKTETMMKFMVRLCGPTITVTTPDGTWRVPRHYIALHGLKADDLPKLGFERVNSREN